jgi:hypothetical protein
MEMAESGGMQPALLLDFYKRRVEDFDAERSDLLARLDACSVSQAELYRLQHENRKRAEEVRELQKVARLVTQLTYWR